MLTIGMSMEYFLQVTGESKTFSLLRSFLGKFGEIKWENITVQEMVLFYEVMLRMSIEPRHIGGYEVYFKPTSYVIFICGYNVKLVRYRGWAKRIMTLASFRHIRAAFHPESGESASGDKCHQVRYLISGLNVAASKTFDLGPTYAFYDGVIATRSRFFCVIQYNKDKQDKYRIDFFVLADSAHFFVRHIDVYQVNNAGKVYIHARSDNTITTIKAFVNGIIAAGVGNDTDGARKMFLDNRYACPEILAILEEDLNFLVGGTCWKNRKGFPGKCDRLTLSRGCERGTFKRLYNFRFHILAAQWKDPKTLQFISSIRKLEKQKSPDIEVKK